MSMASRGADQRAHPGTLPGRLLFLANLGAGRSARGPDLSPPDAAPRPVIEASYTGSFVAGLLATAAWGWHVETATHVLRLIVGGAFDSEPNSWSGTWVRDFRSSCPGSRWLCP